MTTRRSVGYSLFSFCLFLAIIIFWCWSRDVGAALDESTSHTASAVNERDVIGALRPVLRSSGKVARVYFSAYCPPGEDAPVVFPKIKLLAPPTNVTGLAAVRALFNGSRDVSLAEEPEGIIRVTIGSVPKSLLLTRIATLRLDTAAQYKDLFAVQAIIWAPEVQSAMKKMHIRVSNKPIIASENPADERLPHLPALISNITVDQALDDVAKTFRTVVVYGACANSDLIEVRETGSI